MQKKSPKTSIFKSKIHSHASIGSPISLKGILKFIKTSFFYSISPRLSQANIPSVSIFNFSWPGEHAAVNFIWSLFMSAILSRSSKSLSAFKRCFMHGFVWFFAILFSIARLVSGAHWLSDCIAGGLSEALILVAIGIYTPVFQLSTKIIYWIVDRSKSDEKKLP